MSERRLRTAVRNLDIRKQDKQELIPGLLGVPLGGEKRVQVPGRANYVYVRLRGDLSELIQAYNDQVSPAYNLPILVTRDDIDKSKYRVYGKDLGRYNDWGTSAYLPLHGWSHSFPPDNSGAGDVVWVYNRQMMPLLVSPSGTAGSSEVVVWEHVYYKNASPYYAGRTGTNSLLPYKPTDDTARMVLVYIDGNQNPQLEASATYFDVSITGTQQIVSFMPDLPGTGDVPLAGIRLVSGTSSIQWDNIYDFRPFIVGDGFIPTGSFGHTIADEGNLLTDRSVLNFKGVGVWAQDNPATLRTDVNISGSFYALENNTPLGTMLSVDFLDGLIATNTGTALYVVADYATLDDAQTGTSTTKIITPNTLPLWVQDNALVRRDGFGGNARGDGAVDLQRYRSDASQIAGGYGAIVLGGEDNKTLANDFSTVLGGYNNYVSGSYGLAFGDSNEVLASHGIALGRYAKSEHYGGLSQASGRFASTGDAQRSHLTGLVTTFNATPSELFLDQAFARLLINAKSAWYYDVRIIAKSQTNTTENAAYTFTGVIQRDVAKGSTSLNGNTKTVIYEDVAAWDCNVTADTTNGALKIEVTGQSSNTIRWVADIMITQVTTP